MHWNKNDKMDIKWALLKLTQKFVCIKTRIFLHFNASNSKKHARHLKKKFRMEVRKYTPVQVLGFDQHIK